MGERHLLSLSGNIFKTDQALLDTEKAENVSDYIQKTISEHNIQLAILLGGRNMFDSSESYNGDNGQNIEILASIANGLALRNYLFPLEAHNPRLMTGIQVNELAEELIPAKGSKHLNTGKTILLTAGTPFADIDVASVQRAVDFGVKRVFKVDPTLKLDKDTLVSISEAEKENLINKTAGAICIEQGISVFVFNDLFDFDKALSGDYSIGTLVQGE